MRTKDAELRREAKKAGVDWATVIGMYRQVQEEERSAREHANEVRREAWYRMVGAASGSAPFWRHGFSRRWGKKVAERDHTVVPGYDDLAHSMAFDFPEYAQDNGTAELFDFLFSPYDKMPSRIEMIRKAIDRVADLMAAAREPKIDWTSTMHALGRRQAAGVNENVPF